MKLGAKMTEMLSKIQPHDITVLRNEFKNVISTCFYTKYPILVQETLIWGSLKPIHDFANLGVNLGTGHFTPCQCEILINKLNFHMVNKIIKLLQKKVSQTDNIVVRKQTFRPTRFFYKQLSCLGPRLKIAKS